MKKGNVSNDKTLRVKAEELLKKKSDKTISVHSDIDLLRLVHELQVHQIELELQNEELVLAKEVADIAFLKYTELYDFAPSGYLTLSREGKIIEINLQGAMLLGKERQSLMNRMFILFLSDDSKPVFNHFLTNLFSSKVKESCEVIILTKNNLQINVYVTGMVALNGMGCNLTIVDITKIKKAEEILLLITKAVDSSSDAIAISDAKGRHFYQNKAMTDMFGYKTAEEMESEGGNAVLFKNPEVQKEIFGEIYYGKSWSGELDMVTKSGTVLPVYISSDAIKDDKENIIGLISVITDITERKKTELELKENERELVQLNIDKDLFISILGHDLKNPFSNILGLSEILSNEINDLKKEEIVLIATHINKSAQITNKLLEDILMWARTQQGKISFEPRNLSLEEICKSVLEILNPGAFAKNITINYSSRDNINVYADSDMLRTILLNLVSNAIKFSNCGGAIRIEAEDNSDYLTISVLDNGLGITPDDLAKLFNISHVISRKGTANEAGTGLGLLLCKEFVEIHGGKIWVDSELGKGSAVRFTLPFGPN
jgi:PAS domain S-box-containing protein